ncbi:AAA family ATPase [Photobacterium damselae]|uniref:Type II/IV secretion system ATPase TadZ/CpaE associated with Flp pilus assembly n=2 Tax=Photobacterium damselae TaxID=38293 RepID=D0Z548_PHODD|nr:hypothetical protein [Photobacterium damselae]EEZ39082.1 type II/IV secretion system ATPase TadZ/CpaE associated with Flp pilus assembly [Photobacterium damselae subsp. damselae CIP 102761]PSW79384.1 chromosome partitioning protein ParA [Photobacterium damselae]SPY45995.1 Flp pilus assembly protein, ATPase CpaE [Photobacterium damselae]
MFDLVDVLKNKNLDSVSSEEFKSVLFFQTENCKDLVEEVFRFEGISPPRIIKNNEGDIRSHIREESAEIIIIELNESNNVTKDIDHISSLLPNNASVIVIGQEDAISTIRNLKTMGFYYLFWPASKLDIVDFLNNVRDNRRRNFGLGKKRSAKRVAIWGSKGGVGTSLIVAEISKELSEKRNSSCLVMDSSFLGGNLDIMLGLKQFKKRHIALGALTASLDETYASSMTQKVNDMLSLLAIESNELDNNQMKDYSRELSNELSHQVNFIIEDLSNSNISQSDFDYVALNIDTLIIVTEPSVSSVRAAANLIHQLEEKNSSVRCILIVNNVRPEKSATVSMSEIEKLLHKKINVECAYEQSLCDEILRGKSIYKQSFDISKKINIVTSLLLGEEPSLPKKNFLNRIFQSK